MSAVAVADHNQNHNNIKNHSNRHDDAKVDANNNNNNDDNDDDERKKQPQQPQQRKQSQKNIWSDLPRRLTTIGIGVPIIWNVLKHSWSAQLFFMGVHALAAYEYSQLFFVYQLSSPPSIQTSTTTTSRSSTQKITWISFLFPVLSLIMAMIRNDNLFQLVLVVTCATLYLLTMDGTFITNSNSNNYHFVTHCLQGFVQLTIPFRAWYELCQPQPQQQQLPQHYHTVSLLLIAWNCDNGALICGRLFHNKNTTTRQPNQPAAPLWLQRISPAKSMAGLWCGWLAGILTTLFLPTFWNLIIHSSNSYDNNNTSTLYWKQSTVLGRLGVGAVLSLLAIVGDLWESRLKRQYHAKDSSSLLPGHGGVLDRFDSTFLAVLAYRYLIVENKP